VNFSGKALDERGNSISGTTAPMFAVLTLVNERYGDIATVISGFGWGLYAITSH